MANIELQILGNERVAFVGKTGSGKTYAAHALARPLRRLIVLDPKGMIDVGHWRLQQYDIGGERNPTVTEFAKGAPGRYLIRAPVRGYSRLPTWEDYLSETWPMGFHTLYIDEMYGVVPPGKEPGELLQAYYTRGRERLVGTWGATQRPFSVPLVMVSEAEWILAFRLQLQKDKQRIAEFMGPTALNRISDQFGFYLYNALWDNPVYAANLDVGPSDVSSQAEQQVAQERLAYEAK